jgi:hypothetical protein
MLKESEEFVLQSAVNFTVGVINHVFNLDVVSATESTKADLHPRRGMEFSWRIACRKTQYF